MKCTICGQAALPGAMLCRPCRAALKRARYMSVQEMPPVSIVDAGRARRRARKPIATGPGLTAALASTAMAPPRRSTSARRAMAIGAAAIAALAIVAYMGQQRVPPSEPAPVASAPPVGVEEAAGAPIAAPPAEAPPAETRAETRAATAATPGKVPATATSAPRTSDSPIGAHSAADTIATPPVAAPASRIPSASASASRDATLESFGPVPSMVRTAASPTLRTALPTVRPAPPDRWASMRNALAACDREGGLSGFLCDQRVRMDGCDGYWGRVPDCPGPPENPGGQ